MIYAENILILLIAPFIVGFFLLKGEARRSIGFFILGTIVCLLCSYINSFIANLNGLTTIQAAIRLTPIIEEIMKTLPLLFYMIIFIPNKEVIFQCAIATGIGFATFENCCYIVNNGADSFYFILIRGFAAGIMHILCAAMLGYILGLGNEQQHFSWIGIWASVSFCTTYHSIYNLLVASGNPWRLYGYYMPFSTVVLLILIYHLNRRFYSPFIH